MNCRILLKSAGQKVMMVMVMVMIIITIITMTMTMTNFYSQALMPIEDSKIHTIYN